MMTTRLKAAWLLTLLLSVGGYAWHRISLAPTLGRDVTEVEFDRANQGGRVIGAGGDTIVVFSDYTCEAAARLFRTIDSMLQKSGSALSVRVRHARHPGLDSTSFMAAVASECAARQNRHVEVARWLFGNGGRWSEAGYPAGLDTELLESEQFHSCIRSREARDAIAKDLDDAAALGVSGTPTIITRHRMVPGALSPAELLALAKGDRSS